MTTTYIDCTASEVPARVRDGRWDVPGYRQGQIVEVAYGATRADGRTPRYEQTGTRYRRITDRSEPFGQQTRYQRRSDVS